MPDRGRPCRVVCRTAVPGGSLRPFALAPATAVAAGPCRAAHPGCASSGRGPPELPIALADRGAADAGSLLGHGASLFGGSPTWCARPSPTWCARRVRVPHRRTNGAHQPLIRQLGVQGRVRPCLGGRFRTRKGLGWTLASRKGRHLGRQGHVRGPSGAAWPPERCVCPSGKNVGRARGAAERGRQGAHAHAPPASQARTYGPATPDAVTQTSAIDTTAIDTTGAVAPWVHQRYDLTVRPLGPTLR